MRWRGVSHVEFAVLDYDDSIAFHDALYGWLGYDSFSASTTLRCGPAADQRSTAFIASS